MPELPEVEVVRRGMLTHALGKRITDVRIHDTRSIRRSEHTVEEFTGTLKDTIITDVVRRGKYLWIILENADGIRLQTALVIHLGMSGQVLFKTSKFPPEKHLKITVTLGNQDHHSIAEPATEQLRFVDQRIFGGMYLDTLVPVSDTQQHPVSASSASTLSLPYIPRSLNHIARDPLDTNFDIDELRQKMLKTSTAIKRLLLDQSTISGVGNIYADEALWRARLHYAKPAKTMSMAKTRELVHSIQEVFSQALEAGGTSFDALYVNVNGESGYFDRSLNAYGREGQLCYRCQENGVESTIIREVMMKRSCYRCPRCQRAPRQKKTSS
ncbi:bifunctional DNA-formamidopyrimidine glycosylase/DNA-(apurinic or apyrimidinic site) lyase [Rothia sp. P13129]|uniref:bifunctional DNA-formamidopyrimidine glycosylase/DNA-(apurinic or apyrimidinic site) lyase n=1 Tax=Rothia sp. P13129 TaxID=3402664 RepID=UPI003AD2168E